MPVPCPDVQAQLLVRGRSRGGRDAPSSSESCPRHPTPGRSMPGARVPSATLRPVSAVRPPGRTRSRSVPKCAGAARRCGAGVAESDSRGPATGGTVLPLWLAAVNDPTQGSRTDSDRLAHVSRQGCRLNTGPGAGDGIRPLPRPLLRTPRGLRRAVRAAALRACVLATVRSSRSQRPAEAAEQMPGASHGD